MNIQTVIVAVLGLLAVIFGSTFGYRWKRRAVGVVDKAEKAELEALSTVALMEKEKILEALARTRGLGNDDRLRLALVRAALRRTGDTG